MSDTAEKLRHELQAAQRALSEARARCDRNDAEHQAATKELEDNRSALLFMLEDLENSRRKIEQAHQEWMAALDVVNDPIFLHDKNFRILRCNRAYQQYAGIPFKQIIGQPYYEIFPKTDAPLPCCLRMMEMAKAAADEEEIIIGGAIYRSRIFSVHGEQGVYLYSVHAIEDITESKQLKDALSENEEKLRIIFEGALDGILLMDAQTKRFVNGNPAICHMLGYGIGEITQLGVADIHPEQALPHVMELVESLLRGEIQLAADIPVKRKDGSVFYADIKSSPVNFGGNICLLGVFRDTTERKQAEDKLADRERHFRAVTQSANDAIITGAGAGNIVGWNAAAERLFGYTEVEITGQPLTVLMPERFRNLHSEGLARVLAGGAPHMIGKSVELAGLRKDGSEFPLELSLAQWQAADGQFYTAIIRDITERRQAEQKLSESEKLYRSLFENMLNGLAYCQMIFEQDQPHDFIYLSVNATFESLTGLKDVVGRRVSEVIPCIRQSDAMLFEIYGRVSLSGRPERFEIYVEALQQWYWISVYSPAKGYFVAVFDVITERKQAEIAIEHANRALATLSAVNRTLVRAASEDELLQSICQVIVKQHGYRLAWVGYVQHDESKSIKIMAHAGYNEGYLDAMQLTWAETERGMGPSGRAIRSGTSQLCQDMANDPLCLPWREAARQHGFAASIALPLSNGRVFGILHVHAEEANAFTTNEIGLLEEMAGDLAFGVHALHTRHERDLALVKNQEQLVQLHDSLEDTVRAMAAIVEMRDPYTAGHQARVADLAAAIARQIGLPEEQVHAIHLAGVVHDLGKIKVPAEILSKPGKITDIEYSLIKVHPQAGYDILKGIDFPWPIAQMVLQHHERLDGSGYPQGLKGDAILLEARILNVADVVEAMSSHRPYRPGLGIEAALAEIGKQRGIYFDPQVVDACLVLFREQHYSFK